MLWTQQQEQEEAEPALEQAGGQPAQAQGPGRSTSWEKELVGLLGSKYSSPSKDRVAEGRMDDEYEAFLTAGGEVDAAAGGGGGGGGSPEELEAAAARMGLGANIGKHVAR